MSDYSFYLSLSSRTPANDYEKQIARCGQGLRGHFNSEVIKTGIKGTIGSGATLDLYYANKQRAFAKMEFLNRYL